MKLLDPLSNFDPTFNPSERLFRLEEFLTLLNLVLLRVLELLVQPLKPLQRIRIGLTPTQFRGTTFNDFIVSLLQFIFGQQVLQNKRQGRLHWVCGEIVSCLQLLTQFPPPWRQPTPPGGFVFFCLSQGDPRIRA